MPQGKVVQEIRYQQVLNLSLIHIFAHFTAKCHISFEKIRRVSGHRIDTVCKKVEIEFVTPAFQKQRSCNLHVRTVPIT